jgi:hypothetical protein
MVKRNPTCIQGTPMKVEAKKKTKLHHTHTKLEQICTELHRRHI